MNGIYGASWSEDGTIFYGAIEGIFKVAAAGGEEADLLVQIDPSERVHGPQLLPGGEWLLFTFRPAHRDRLGRPA